MCDRAKWCIVDGPCVVHDRYPGLRPTQIGPLSAAPDCTAEDRKYIGSLRFRVTIERVVESDDRDEDEKNEDDPDDDDQSGDYGSGR